MPDKTHQPVAFEATHVVVRLLDRAPESFVFHNRMTHVVVVTVFTREITEMGGFDNVREEHEYSLLREGVADDIPMARNCQRKKANCKPKRPLA